MVTGAFSVALAGVEFLYAATVGIFLGALWGWLAASLHRRLDDPPVQTTISLLTPFAAYLSADKLGASGILAVAEILSPRMRLQVMPVWEIIVFLLNGLIFILVGLQLPLIRENLPGLRLSTLCYQAIILNFTMILIRVVRIFLGTYLSFLIQRWPKRDTPSPKWRDVAVVAWTGMRGVVSLAAAMALPLTTSNGSAFPGRDLIIFHSFAFILVTLVLQGLSLPFIIRWLKLEDEGAEEGEEREARLEAYNAVLSHLEGMSARYDAAALAKVRTQYQERIQELRVYNSRDQEPRLSAGFSQETLLADALANRTSYHASP